MNKPSIFAAALVLLTAAPVTNAQQTTDVENFAMAFIAAETAAWERGEYDALEALEHADVIFQNINGTVFRGWAEHKKAIEDTKAGFGNAPITQEWRYLMGEGNMFAVSYRWTIHAPNEPVEIVGIAVGRLENGKLKEEWGGGCTVVPEYCE